MKTPSAILAEHPFVRTMKPEHLELLAQGAVEATFEPGEVIFRQGDPANRFYLLIDGKVALEAHTPANGETLIEAIGEGDVIGWSWLFEPFDWHLQARALERTTAVVLDGAHLLVMAHENHEFGFELMKRVAQIVIHRLQATRQRLLAAQ